LLPGMHGMEVCRRMRAMAQVPIVMVSAVDTELDVVLGLELGAAGYVTKPFRLRELVARMQAILRRLSPPGGPAVEAAPPDVPSEPAAAPDETPAFARFGAVMVDFVRREVTVDDEQTHLSRREFDLLAVLLSPARRVRTRDELIDLLWPDARHPHPPAPGQARARSGRAPVHRHRAGGGLPHRPRRHPACTRPPGPHPGADPGGPLRDQPKRPFT